MPPSGGYFFWRSSGIRKDGSTEGRVKKCPVDTFLVRGRIHILMNAPSMGVDMRILFVAVRLKNETSKVYTNNKIIPTHLGGDYFGYAAGFENQIQAAGGSLVAARWMAAKHLFSAQQKMQTNP